MTSMRMVRDPIADASHVLRRTNYLTSAEFKDWQAEHMFSLLDADVYHDVTEKFDRARMPKSVRAAYEEMKRDIAETTKLTEADFSRGKAEVTIQRGADLVVELEGANASARLKWVAMTDRTLGPGEEHYSGANFLIAGGGVKTQFYWDDALNWVGRRPGDSEHTVTLQLQDHTGQAVKSLKLTVKVDGPDDQTLVDDANSRNLSLDPSKEIRFAQGIGATESCLTIPWIGNDTAHQLVSEVTTGTDDKTGLPATFVRVADYRDPNMIGAQVITRNETNLRLPLLAYGSMVIVQNQDFEELYRKSVDMF